MRGYLHAATRRRLRGVHAVALVAAATGAGYIAGFSGVLAWRNAA